MRRLAAALALALALAGVIFGCSSAPATARTCAESIRTNGSPISIPPWFEAQWRDVAGNNSCHWYLRGFVHCKNARSLIFATGGWVTSLGLWSKATCPNGYNFLQGAGHDYKTCASCAFHREWDYGNQPNRRRRPGPSLSVARALHHAKG